MWFSSFSATSNISSVTNTLGLTVFNFSCHFLLAYSCAHTHTHTHAVYHDVLGFHAYLIAPAVWQIAHRSFHYLWPSEATLTADNRERLPERKGRENRQRDPYRDQGESERAGGSALEGKAGAVWEINASVKHGEVAMAGVRSISHTHPQTDSKDHASERSVSTCVRKPKTGERNKFPLVFPKDLCKLKL